MFFSTSTIAALCAPFFVASVTAAPVSRDANHNQPAASGSSSNSVTMQVLQFANVLEQLETQFYTQGIAKFQTADFTNAGFTNAQVPIEQLTVIVGDEQAHATALASAIQALGGQPITSCSFNFGSVLTDVPTMASAARLVENVGVSAYLGAAGLVADPQILTAAASILTIEARHQTMLNVLNNGNAIPQSFDMALTPAEVLTIAGPFISGCELGITPNAALAITNTGTVSIGTLLTFSSDAINGVDPSTLTCQMLVGGQATALAFPLSNCVVPSGVDGIVYIYITNNGQPLANDPTIRDNGSVVAGPTAAFIDSQPQTIDALIRTPSNVAAGSAQTTTINPAAATTLASAAATTTAGAVQTPPPAAGPATVIGTPDLGTTPAAQPTPPPAAPPVNVGGTSAPAAPGPASVLGFQPSK
ncbi:hypothetical protein BOTBODRAFT_26641 [Botryobasidium botryosum FD-172 SS1]|uniref:Ferritin-like domain-containing protein n=1 Tax=Botryobasidium botryosum (strain FD-172 SS1) TaxID=930990 RepID=A0A067MYD9_BOTB1|nr:hypothetical protein BOTBODRAFT_26641 [Botryobasidium botryosum FD-172 SS1]